VQTHQKYAEKNISFVSLTTDGKDNVAAFAKEFAIPWACGYQADVNMIAELGAFNEGMVTPGYEAKPTLYLVASTGEVLWCDQHQRMNHQDPRQVIDLLEEAIDKHMPSDGSD